MTASRRTLARTFLRLVREQPDRRAELVKALAAQLVTQRQARQVDLFLKDLAREALATDKVLLAEVQSAFALDAATRQHIHSYLQGATKATDVELIETTNRSLLSGVIVRIPNAELDTTARRKLMRLTSLTQQGERV